MIYSFEFKKKVQKKHSSHTTAMLKKSNFSRSPHKNPFLYGQQA